MNSLRWLNLLVALVAITTVQAQVNTVQFGKNRVQYQKFKWKYLQTDNFNCYFSQDGLGLGEYVGKIAEQELPGLEAFVEYGMQRRINIVVYNNYDEMQQSNIGLGIDWQNTGGLTKLVNNKMIVYFDGNHQHLRYQIREGIARNLVENILFGEDIGDMATNQTLLDLPKWLTDGYITYAAENWNTDLDDELRAVMLAGLYRNFYHFAFEKPALAGHAFWKYIADKYDIEFLNEVHRLNPPVYQELKNNSRNNRYIAKFFGQEYKQFYKFIDLKNSYIIRLKRSNLLDQILSHYVAVATGLWINYSKPVYKELTVKVDKNIIDASVRAVLEHNYYCDTLPFRPDLDVRYEDIGTIDTDKVFVGPQIENREQLLELIIEELKNAAKNINNGITRFG